MARHRQHTRTSKSVPPVSAPFSTSKLFVGPRIPPNFYDVVRKPKIKKKKQRAPARYKSHRKMVNVCVDVPTKSTVAQHYIMGLHAKQHNTGTVKIPGYRERYIVDKYLRKEARESPQHRRRVMSRIRYAFNSGKLSEQWKRNQRSIKRKQLAKNKRYK